MLRKIYHSLFTKKLRASEAYNILSKKYDDELNNDNIAVFYNSILLKKVFKSVNLQQKTILDIGAGTGTNYLDLMQYEPSKYIACDVSEGMLNIFSQKHPEVEKFVINNEKLPFMEDNSADAILSSLMIGYVKDLHKTFSEWDRVIKPNGHIIISFLSPSLSGKKSSRSFKDENNKTIFIENYKHDTEKMLEIFSLFNLEVLNFLNEKVDKKSIEIFKRIKKEQLFNEFQEKEIICGYVLKKRNN
ncbi:MAG: class I SAM-dependent methyltransferase [Tenacibaculum sp.]|nr:class I SAM-dependent methyltransferase [Tenacibaculum sp.]